MWKVTWFLADDNTLYISAVMSTGEDAHQWVVRPNEYVEQADIEVEHRARVHLRNDARERGTDHFEIWDSAEGAWSPTKFVLEPVVDDEDIYNGTFEMTFDLCLNGMGKRDFEAKMRGMEHPPIKWKFADNLRDGTVTLIGHEPDVKWAAGSLELYE